MQADDTVEKVARAICEAVGDDWQIASGSEALDQYVKAARAALAAMAGEAETSLQKVQTTAPPGANSARVHSPDYLRGYQDAVRAGIDALRAVASAVVKP